MAFIFVWVIGAKNNEQLIENNIKIDMSIKRVFTFLNFGPTKIRFVYGERRL